MALNPIIKFTTLFGLLAVELAVSMTEQGGGTVVAICSGGPLFATTSVFPVLADDAHPVERTVHEEQRNQQEHA